MENQRGTVEDWAESERFLQPKETVVDLPDDHSTPPSTPPPGTKIIDNTGQVNA
jgi:hypothetical protein